MELIERLRGIEPCKDLVALRNEAADEIERLRYLFNKILMLNVENPYSAQLNEMANALARSALSR